MKLVWTLDDRELLLSARSHLRVGALTYADYRAIENRLVGHLSRDHRCFVSGTDGIERSSDDGAFLVFDKVTALPCPAVDEFAYVSGCTELELQVTLPRPDVALHFWGDQTAEVYSDARELVADAEAVVSTWTAELADAGCRHVELGRASSANEVVGLIEPLWTTRKEPS